MRLENISGKPVQVKGYKRGKLVDFLARPGKVFQPESDNYFNSFPEGTFRKVEKPTPILYNVRVVAIVSAVLSWLLGYLMGSK